MGNVQNFHPPNRAADDGPSREWLKLLEEHRSSLRRVVAAKMNGEGEAAIDDLMQELAIATQANGPGSVERSKVGAWLRQVATRKVQDYWRREGRRRNLHGRLVENRDPVSESAGSPASPCDAKGNPEVEKALEAAGVDGETAAQIMKALSKANAGDKADEKGGSCVKVESKAVIIGPDGKVRTLDSDDAKEIDLGKLLSGVKLRGADPGGLSGPPRRFAPGCSCRSGSDWWCFRFS